MLANKYQQIYIVSMYRKMLKFTIKFAIFHLFIRLLLFEIVAAHSGVGTKATVNKARSSKIVTTGLGKVIAASCYYHGNPKPRVDWIKDGRKIPRNCTKCVTEQDNSKTGVSRLFVTPYRAEDWGEYTCKVRNAAGFDSLKVHLKMENGSDAPGHCQVERIQAEDPRMKLAFLPKCDADGSYHVIQCSIHVSRCWCVDRQTGHKVADALTTEGVDTMHCTPPEDLQGVAITTVIMGIILVAVAADIALYLYFNRGLTHRLLTHRNKRKMYNKLKKHEDKLKRSTEDQEMNSKDLLVAETNSLKHS